MRAEIMAPARSFGAVAAIVITVCAASFLYFSAQPLNPDIAWLIEATRRWAAGGELYRDIIEVNPPLIFYENLALTAGTLTSDAYLIGTCVALALSCLWVLRLHGAFLALSSLAAIVLGGITDFGQRDHLALIFVIPFLLGERAGRVERASLGIWAFLGVGLKPHLLAIPIAAVLVRAILGKSVRPIFAAEMIALGAACSAYVALILVVHPAYLTEIVPLARFVYWMYDAPLERLYVLLSAVLALLALYPLLLRDREKLPLAAAVVAGLLSFYLQGRYWPYHFVPAIGLGILLALWLARDRRLAVPFVILLCTVQLVRGPYRLTPPNVIPEGATSVAFLSADVWPAYPAGLSVRHATRYPALWTVPGALLIARDESRPAADRRRAAAILEQERRIIRGDLLRERPQFIFADRRSLDYMSFVGPLPDYRYAGRAWIYDVWVPRRARPDGDRPQT